MTREEAIELLDNLVGMVSDNQDSDYDTALKMAIKALSQEPTEKPMTVDEMEREYEKSKALFHKIVERDDAISRDALIAKLTELIKTSRSTIEIRAKLIPMIEQLPSVTQKLKTGHWILTDDDFVYCSECEDSYYPRPIDASWYYCPHCGAKMVEPQESEE